MGCFVGIDYGSVAVKAVATQNGNTCESLAMGDAAYLANVVSKVVSDKPAFHLEHAFPILGGHRSPTCATLFRDEVVHPDSTFSCGDWNIGAVAAQRWLWESVKRELIAGKREITSLAVAVPDQWPRSAWSLPVVLAEAGVLPQFLVRESLAAIAATPVVLRDSMIAVSAGVGALRLSHVVVDGGSAGIHQVATHAEVSGRRCRERLTDWLAEDVIATLRRDPREDAETQRMLHVAAHAAVDQLRHMPIATCELSVGGKRYARQLSCHDLLKACDEIASQARQHLLAFFSQCSRQGLRPTQIIVWGELATILPFASFCKELGAALHLPGIEVVAAGAARICAQVCAGTLPITSSELIGARLADGAIVEWEASFERANDVLPVIERLPVREKSEHRAGKARLVMSGGNAAIQPIEFNTDVLRLGRDTNSDVILGEAEFPMVSKAHAMVFRRDGAYVVRDLGSSNGTYVNGKRIDEQVLKDGDELRLGKLGPRFVFESRVKGGKPTSLEPRPGIHRQ